MGEFYKIVTSNGSLYLVEVSRFGPCDYRATLRNCVWPDDPGSLRQESAMEVKQRTIPDQWTEFHGASAVANALRYPIEHLSSFLTYVTEVLPVAEPTRVELLSSLERGAEALAKSNNTTTKCLDKIDELEERCKALETSAMQAGQHADSYKRRLMTAEQELRVLSATAVEFAKQKEAVEAFCLENVKAEA